jgi:hypothetical protein
MHPMSDLPVESERAAQDARWGGTLERGLSGDYRIGIGATLSEAWRLTRGFKRTCLTGLAALALAVFALWLVVTVIEQRFGNALLDNEMLEGLVVQLAFVAVIYPFLIGPVMMGVRRAVGLPVSARMAFGYMNVAGAVIVASLLIALLSLIGTVMLILPAVYLTVAYALFVPLIADRRLGPWVAMEVSRRAITKHWFAVAGVLVATGIIVLVSALPFLIGAALLAKLVGFVSAICVSVPLAAGLLWTIPMAIVVVGILYRDVFGVTERS